MNKQHSHAHRVLLNSYRCICTRMRWLNAMSERGLSPVRRAVGRMRYLARRVHDSTSHASAGRRAPSFGLRRMEALEMRLMLASHDGSQDGPDATYTFVAPSGVSHIQIVSSPDNDRIGRILGNSGGDFSTNDVLQEFTNFARVIVDTTTNDASAAPDDFIEIEGTGIGLSSLTVLTGAGDDRINVSQAVAASEVAITVDGGGGSDTITGVIAADADAPSIWTITGPDAGTWHDDASPGVSFTGVENLTGVDGVDDVFNFNPGGSLSGMVTGQDRDLDKISVTVVAGDLPHTVSFNDGTGLVDALAVYHSTNVIDAENVIIDATVGDDQAVLAAASSFATLTLASTNLSFQPITFQQPQGLVSIDLKDGNDTFSVAAGGLPNALIVVVTGGDGIDTIVGPAADSTANPPAVNDWQIAGVDAGAINNQVVFTGVENLVGAAGIVDTFTFLAGGRQTGTVTGQLVESDSILIEITVDATPEAAPRSLSFGSGITSLNGTPIVTYADIGSPANIRINGTLGDDFMLLGPGAIAETLLLSSGTRAFASIEFDRPASLTLAPGRGNDRVTVTAASLPATLSIFDEDGTDSLFVAVPGGLAPLSVDLTAATDGTGSIGVGATSITYAGIEDSQNLVIEGTDGADTLALMAADNQLELVVNGQSIMFDRPTGSLAIRGLGDDDTISVAAGLALTCSLTLDGGTGIDAVSLAGTLGAVILTASDEAVTSTAAIDTLTFQATAAADFIRLASPSTGSILIESLNATFSPLTLPMPLAGLEIDARGGNDNITVEVSSFAPALFIDGQAGEDTLTIPDGSFRSLGYAVEHGTNNAVVGDLIIAANDFGESDTFISLARDPITQRIVVASNGVTISSFSDPSGSLTLQTGRGADGASRVEIDALTLNADLTVDCGNGADSITVLRNILLPGHNLALVAEEIVVNAGVTLSTRKDDGSGHTVGNSGAIELNASADILSNKNMSVITLHAGARLLSDVNAGAKFVAGDIRLTAINTYNIPTPYVHLANTHGIITLEAATIRGRNVTVQATGDSTSTYSDDSGEVSAAEIAAGYAATTFSMSDVGGIAISTAEGTITVGTGTSIVAANVGLYAKAKTEARVWAYNAAMAFAIGVSKPSAKVTVEGGAIITTTGDVLINTQAESMLSISAKQGILPPISSVGSEKYSVTVAVGVTDVVSKADVKAGSAIHAGGNVDVTSRARKENDVAANAGAYDEGSVGVGLAFALFTSDVLAAVGGTASAGGHVTVEAALDTISNSTRANAVVGTGEGLKIVRSLASGAPSAPAWLSGGARGASGYLSFFMGQSGPSHLLQEGGTALFDAKTGNTKPIAISGAIAVTDQENKVTATIRAEAKVVAVIGGVNVNATTSEAPETRAISMINSDTLAAVGAIRGNNRDKSYSVALNVGVFRNIATATIDDGAQIVAGGAIDVTATATVPFDARWLQITGPRDITDKVNTNFGIQSGFFASWAQSNAKGNQTAYAGGVDYFRLTNDAHATVGEYARLNEYAVASRSAVDATADTLDLGVANSFADGALVVYDAMGSEPIGGLVSGGRYKVAKKPGDPNRIHLTTLGGLRIHLAPATSHNVHALRLASPTAQQDVVVRARTEGNVLNLAGNVAVKVFTNKAANGVGAAYVHCLYDNIITAEVMAGARVHGDTVFVRADNDFQTIDIGVSAGAPKGVGFNGAGSAAEVNNVTHATIADGAVVTTGAGTINVDREYHNYFGEDNANDTLERFLGTPGQLATFTPADVDATTDSISIEFNSSDSIHTGSKVRYRLGGTNPIGGLTTADTYYVILRSVEGNTSEIQLAATEADAENGVFLNLDPLIASDGSVHRFLKPEAEWLVEQKPLALDTNHDGELTTDDAGIIDITSLAYETNLSLLVMATDESRVYNIVGGVVTSQNAGFGVSVAVNLIDRDTQAFVGRPFDDESSAGAVTTLDSAGRIRVTAANAGNQFALTLAAAVVSQNPATGTPTDPLDGVTDVATDQLTGIGIAGASSVTILADDARAYINTVGSITATAVEVLAENRVIVATVTGAVASATSTGASANRNNMGLAGAFSYDELSGKTQAFVEDATMVVGSLDIEAKRRGEIIAIAGGGSGASGSSGMAVAGSVAVNKIADTLDAHVANAHITSIGDVSVTASEGSLIWSLAGAMAFGGSGGFGVAIGVNLIGTTEVPAITEAYVQASTIEIAAGVLEITATIDTPGADSNPRICAVTGSYGQGQEEAGTGFAGMIAVNVIHGETRAFLKETLLTETPNVPGTVGLRVDAEDDSAIIAVSGAVGVGQTTGVGAAIGYNEIRATTEAYLDDSDVTVSGTVEVIADSTTKIGGCVVGVGVGTGASALALAGSSATNVIALTVDAHVALGSTVHAGDAVDITATDHSEIVSVGGGVTLSMSGSRGAGVAIGYNRISNGIAAFIDDSEVSSAASHIAVVAVSTPLLVGIAGAGAGAGGAATTISGAGTIVINSIANAIDASITQSVVTAAGDVQVAATEGATMCSVAVAVAGSANGSGIGAMLAYNYIGGTINPADPNVVSINDGVVDGTFVASTADSGTTSDVSAVIEDSAVIAGGRVVVASGFQDPATLPDSGPAISSTVLIDPASAVALTGDAIRFGSGHGLQNGDRVVYHPSDGTSIAGLQAGQSYYVIVADPQTIKLAATLDDAVAGRAVPLSGTGSGLDHRLSSVDVSRQQVFDASADSVNANQIIFPAAHGFTTGQEVVYFNNNNGSQASIGGLTSGRSYYCIRVDDTTIRVATSQANAHAGVAIPLVAVNANDQSFDPVNEDSLTFAPSTAVAITTPVGDQITFASPHGLSTGDAVMYRNGGGGNASLGGLQDAETYYAIVIDDTHIRLARTLHDTEAGSLKPIMLTSIGTGSEHALAVKTNSVTVGEVTIDLPAAISSQITSASVGGGGGTLASGAGAISLNFVRTKVDAHISRPAGTAVAVSAAQGAAVLAVDSSRIESGAGTLVISTGGASIGASIGLNDVKNIVSATIDGIRVDSSAGDIEVKATETARVLNVVVGGSGSGGSGLAAGGSFSINVIHNTVDAHVAGNTSSAARIDAHGSITIQAVDTASIATLAGNAGLNFGGTSGVGVAFAYNDIFDTVTAMATAATLRAATGGITVDAEFSKPTELPPCQNVQIAAMAVSAGTADSIAGAGSVATNWIRTTVTASISDIPNLDPTAGADEISAGGALSITASDSSTIESLAGAFSLAGWGVSGASGAIGASVSYNVLGGDPRNPASQTVNSVRASLERIGGSVQAGSIDVHATHHGEISNVTVAGAAAGSFSLGGSVSINTVRIATEAVIADAVGVTTTQTGASSVRVRADDEKSKIWTMAGGVGIAIPKDAGLGVAAGVAAAENLVTSTTTASVVTTKLTSAGGIGIEASSDPTIHAWTIGVAVAAGSGTGGKFAGAGAGSGNTVNSTTEAFVRDAVGTDGIAANGGWITVSAEDRANILAVAGAFAIAGSLGGGGVAGSVGASVTENIVTPVVHAFLETSSVRASGGLLLHSEEDATINAHAIGGTISVSSGAASTSVAIAATKATNTVDADVESWMTGVSTGTTSPGSVTLEAVQTSEIIAHCVSASVSIAAAEGAGVSLSGGGAAATNTIESETHATIDDSTIDSRGGLKLNAVNTATIDATVAAVSLSAAGGQAGLAVAIGASLADNEVTGTTESLLKNSTVTASGKIAITAEAAQTVEALVLAGAVALSNSAFSGGAGAGSGASSINTVGMHVIASIDGDGSGGIRGSEIFLSATDTSTIDVDTAAATIAGASSSLVAGTLSISASIARNTVNNTVDASITNADTHVRSKSGDIAIHATENANIHAWSMAASLSVSLSGGAGVGVAGAGAEATNVILTKTNAYVDASNLESDRNVVIDSSTSTPTLFTLPSSLTAADLDDKSRLDEQAQLPEGITDAEEETRSGYDTELRAAFTNDQQLARGDIQVVTLAAGQAWQLTDKKDGHKHNLFFITLEGGLLHVSQPMITAAVISAAMGVGAGSTAGGGAAIGASLTQNLIGFTASGEETPAEVRSTVTNSSIAAVGSLTQSATNAVTIDASAFAGSVAASGGSLGGGSLGGAGARVLNKVATLVEATIDGDGNTGIEAADVVLTANDTSVVSAWTGAVAVAAALGGVGASMSIGVGRAESFVHNTIDASIINADNGVTATTGDIRLTADSKDVIASTVWAGSMALGVGGTAGIAVAGAGVEGFNTLGNTVKAHVENSTVDVRAAAGNLSITADEHSSLLARGVAAAAAIAGSGVVAIAAAAVGGDARNIVSNSVHAFVSDSSVNARSTTAQSGGGAVTISAAAAETLAVKVIGAVGAVAIAPAGGAVTVGVARSRNEVTDDISAYVSGGILHARGLLTIEATAIDDVTAQAWAAAASFSSGSSFAAGGAEARNTLSNTIDSAVDGEAVIVAGGDLSISATQTATFHAGVAAVAVAGGGYGGSIGISTIANSDTGSITARVSGGSLTSTGGNVTIAATAEDDTRQTLGVATAVTAALGAAGSGTHIRTTYAPALTSQVEAGAAVTALLGAIAVTSTLTSNATAETYGAAGGAVAIGSATAEATSSGSVDALVDGTLSARSIQLGSLATTTARVSATGLAGGVVSGSGAEAIAVSSPEVTATATSTSSLSATDALRIVAKAIPSATSRAIGIAVGVASGVGVSLSDATASPVVTAKVDSTGGGLPLSATSLVVEATIAPGESGSTADAFAIAGAGGLLLGAMGASCSATSAGSATATIGNTVGLPDGNVEVTAAATTYQVADATGIAGGFVGIGGVDATSTAAVATTASLGTGITSASERAGALVVIATGANTNVASTTAGSGGVIAGNSSTATTADTSVATATILGGTIHAGSIVVAADQSTEYAPNADSVNVSLVGGSGAYARNTATTGATTTIGSGTKLLADSAVRLASNNRYRQAQNDFSSRGGAGGAISGSASLTHSTLDGTSSVTLGDATTISSDGLAGSIVLVASHDLNTSDTVKMESGGLISGAGVISDLHATLTNTVMVGTGSSLWSSGDISVGTYTTANASTRAEASTFGLAGGGSATATTSVASDQDVTIGSGSTIFSQGNIRLTAGRDTAGNNTTSLSGSSIARAFSYGVFNIGGTVATTEIDDNTSLDIQARSRITAAGNVEIGATAIDPDVTASGEAFWNGANFPTKLSVSHELPHTSGLVTNNGTIEAGIYRTLRITIPDSRNASVIAGSDQPMRVESPSPSLPSTPAGGFSRTITVNPGNEPFLPFTVTPISRFDPVAYVNANYDPELADLMLNGVSSTPVYALRLDGLQARGGTVTVDAATFAGTGSITAHGAPSIVVENKSPDYLIVGNVSIPDLPGGQIIFTGSGAEAGAAASGMILHEIGANIDPQVSLSNSFNGASGTSSLGPALFIDNPIVNLAGGVTISNLQGSVGQLSEILAGSVDINAANGFYVVDIKAPETTYFAGAMPASQWKSSMIWPGGNPAVAGYNAASAAREAAAYVANAVYNASGTSTTTALNTALLSHGTTTVSGTAYTNAIVMYSGSVPRWSSPTVDAKYQGSTALKNLSPAGTTSTLASTSATTYVFPTVPSESLSKTVILADNPAVSAPTTSAIEAGKIAIKAQFIDVNGTIQSGHTAAVDIRMNADDLDGLAALYDTLRGKGISLPTETVNNAGKATNADVRSIIAQIWSRGDNAGTRSTLRQLLTYQYLGFFNGTSTAHIPLTAPNTLQRTLADAYATAVITRGMDPISPQLSRSTWIRQSGDLSFQFDIRPSFDDSLAKVTFDLSTKTIECDNIVANPGAGFVSLRGAIINTGTAGKIVSAGGAGRVQITNPSSYPLIVHDIHTADSGSADSPAGVVDIIDTQKAAGSGHTVYVYRPDTGVKQYVGSVDTAYTTLIAGTPATSTSGQSASYQPASDLRWQWVNYATITRTITYGASSLWNWNTPNVSASDLTTDPWMYVTSQSTGTDGSRLTYNASAGGYLTRIPTGTVVTQAGGEGFRQTITGHITDSQFLSVTSSAIGNRRYEFVTDGWLKMTNSVKADNPFGVSFNVTAGLVDITSAGLVSLLGRIVNPQGATHLQAAGLKTVTATAIESGDLTITAPGSAIGTATAPLDVTLAPATALTATAGAAGVVITSSSPLLLDQVTAQAKDGSFGDIRLSSRGAIDGVTGKVNVEGRRISLASDGAIGSASTGVTIHTNNSNGVKGTIRASAQDDIRLSQVSDDLRVDSIASRAGNVIVNVPAGRVLNSANQTSARALSRDQIQQVWSDLRLTAATGAAARLQDSVASYQNQVSSQYRQFWQIAADGSVTDGVFTLASTALERYRERATIAMGSLTPATNLMVLEYARGLYNDLRGFFDRNSNTDYWRLSAVGDSRAAAALATPSRTWMARPEFTAYAATYTYTATADQAAALTRNGVWTESDLDNAVPMSALAASTVVGENAKPNITGRDVTINDSRVSIFAASGVGKVTAPVIIPISDLRAGTLSDIQRAALLTASAPGDIVLYGKKDGVTQAIAFIGGLPAIPDGMTLSHLSLRQTAPLFTNAAGVVTIRTVGDIYLQSTANDLKVGQITASSGAIDIIAPGSILAAGGSSTIQTEGTIFLLAGHGGIGSAGMPVGIHADSSIAASAGGGGVNLRQAQGDMRVMGVMANGYDVNLQAASGSILDAAGGNSPVVTAANVVLNASGSIGLPGQDLVVNIGSGLSLTATAGSGIQLTQSSGDLRVARATTSSGGVRLTVPTGSLSLPLGASLGSTNGPALLQARNAVTLADGSHPSAATWFAIIGRYGRTGADSAIETTRSDGTSVIAAPYVSIGQWETAGSGPVTAAESGLIDSGKTTLATLSKAAGPVAVDSTSNYYFFDPTTRSLKQVDWTGSTRTLLSSGLNGVTGLAVDGVGNVMIADRALAPVTVQNGSFESAFNALGAGPLAYQYSPKPSGQIGTSTWVFSIDGSSNRSGLTRNSTNYTSLNANAPAGTQVAFLQGTGSISQSMAFEAGSYTLSLSAAQRKMATAINAQHIGVFIDDISVGTLVPSSIDYLSYSTPSFTVTQGQHTVALRGLSGSTNTAFVDSVSIQPTWSPGIRAWNAATGALSTITTTAHTPLGVTVDAAGNIFYIDGNDIEKWAPTTGAAGTLPFTALNTPSGLAIDASGNLYVADTGNDQIRKWSAATNTVATLSAFSGLHGPRGIAVSSVGDVLVADTGSNLVKILDASSQTVHTLISAGLSGPSGLAIDGRGNVATINSGATASTLDVFQPWTDVPSSSVGMLTAAATAILPAIESRSHSLYGVFVPVSDRPWLHIVGSIDGAVQFRVDAAPSGINREGHITVLGRQIKISQAAGITTTALLAPSIIYGATGTVTVTVQSTQSTPTGTVTLAVIGRPLSSATLAAAQSATSDGITIYTAVARFPVASLPAGTHAVSATYASQARFVGSSATGAIGVTKASVAPTVTQPKSTTVYGQAATFTATLRSVPGGTIPAGYVQFYSGSNPVGGQVAIDDKGRATFTGIPRIMGTRTVTAKYFGDMNYDVTTSAAIVHTVLKASVVPTVTSSTSTTVYGQPATFTATLRSVPGGTIPTGYVQFYGGGKPIGGQVAIDAEGLATVTGTPRIAGSRMVTAQYLGDRNYAATTSAAIVYMVTQASVVPTVTSSTSTTVLGQPAAFTATLFSVPGGTIPTGYVQFYSGGKPIGGQVAIDAKGLATFTGIPRFVGSRMVTAKYLGDRNYAATTSAAIEHTVTQS